MKTMYQIELDYNGKIYNSTLLDHETFFKNFDEKVNQVLEGKHPKFFIDSEKGFIVFSKYILERSVIIVKKIEK